LSSIKDFLKAFSKDIKKPVIKIIIPAIKATNPGPGSLKDPISILQLRKHIPHPMRIQITPSFILKIEYLKFNLF